MYILDGIAYAGEPAPMLEVASARPLDGGQLWVRFNTGGIKVFDFTPLLNRPAFAPLADARVFASVRIDRGVPVWNDGEIDIAPEALYARGSDAE